MGKRNINYLEDASLSKGSSKLFENRKFEYRIQVNDVLSIRVRVSTNRPTGSSMWRDRTRSRD